MKKVYYWNDMLHDDFASTNIQKNTIPDDYKFSSRNPFYCFFEMLIRIIAYPIIYLILKCDCLFRIKNRKVIRQIKGRGYFLYGNHTNYLLDAYMPYVICFPRKNHIIVNADALSIPGIRMIVKMLGGVPIPGTVRGMMNMKRGVSDLISRKRVVTIYPEAHIWPYYTDIRPFEKTSFHYPVEANSPCFAFTNIYTQRKLRFIKKPKVVTYVDGPFFPDETLPKPQRIQKLRDEVYAAMKKRVDENPKYNYCDYIYVDDPSKSNRKQ